MDLKPYDLDQTTPPTDEELAELEAMTQNALAALPPLAVVDVAKPGTTIRRVRTQASDGEMVTGYRKVPLSVMYRGINGLRIYSPPNELDAVTQAKYAASFAALIKSENLQLVPRKERKAMWAAEKKKIKERIKKRKAEVARLTEAAE